MGIRIEADRYYPEHELRLMGLDGEALEEARGRGELRGREVGGTVVYKGAWVIDWLDREPAGAS